MNYYCLDIPQWKTDLEISLDLNSPGSQSGVDPFVKNQNLYSIFMAAYVHKVKFYQYKQLS